VTFTGGSVRLTPRGHYVLEGRDRWATPPRWNGGVRVGPI
jgi:hypothetical protein